MNNTVYYNSWASDEVRRQHLYDGQLFVYSPDLVALYDDGTDTQGELIYMPKSA